MNSTPDEPDADDAFDAVDAFEVEVIDAVEAPSEAVTPTFADPDPSLFEAHDLARAALLEITPAATVGAPLGYSVEAEGVVSLHFETTLEGYPGWHWTVSVTRVEGAEPTVLEVELLPGEGALLAPDWLPWAERLAEYQAAAAAERALTEGLDVDGVLDDDVDAELDDLDDLDAADFDEDGSPTLHAGDLDGVDIDVLDEDAPDDEDDEDDEDEDAPDDDDDEDAPDDDEG